MRSSYTAFVREDTVCVIDEDEGRSVTNDIEAVIADLRRAGVLIAGRCLIYRDSDGVWDGVTLDAELRFVRFYPINERSLDAALKAIHHD